MQIVIAGMLIGIFYLLIQWIFRKKWDKNLTVRVYCEQEYAYEGETLTLVEEIINQKAMLLPAVKVKFATSKEWKFEEEKSGVTSDQYYRNDIFSVGMYEKIKRSLPFVCQKRGYYALGDMDVFASSYFYTREYVMRKKQEQWVYVFPKRVQTPLLSMYVKQMIGQTLAKKRLYEDPFTFQGIRDYQSYDGMRKINWKSSAKTGILKVNCYEYTAEQEVKLILYFDEKDMGLDNRMEEYTISLAAALAEQFLGQQIVVSMVTNGLDVEHASSISIGAGAGSNHMRQIDEGLARVDLHKKVALESAESFLQRELKGEGLHVLITASQSAATQQIMLQHRELSEELIWMLPHYEMEKIQIAPDLQEKVMEIVADGELR